MKVGKVSPLTMGVYGCVLRPFTPLECGSSSIPGNYNTINVGSRLAWGNTMSSFLKIILNLGN